MFITRPQQFMDIGHIADLLAYIVSFEVQENRFSGQLKKKC